jgi:magnesium/cobalt transport protein CorA
VSVVGRIDRVEVAARRRIDAFVFGHERSGQVEDWRATLGQIGDDQLLWIALHDVAEEGVAELQEVLELDPEHARRLLDTSGRPSLVDAGERLHVTMYAAGGDGADPVQVPVHCILGPGWVVTAQQEEVDVLDDFRERAVGGGQVGELDAPSFVASIGDWVVAGYLRAFESVEAELEELDAKVMSGGPPADVTDDLERLVHLRRSIGTLRRSLAPHREVFVALAHPELDTLSTEDSAERFSALEDRVIQAMEVARETKESTFGSFDLLVARIGQRTNDVMKILTLVTVILLPSTVLGGVMGMNFKVGFFESPWMFWVVVSLMLGIAVVVLVVARVRRWI